MVLQGRLISILKLLEQRQTVTVGELCDEFGVSESTVRRDLVVLEEKGKLIRVHGGAAITEDSLLNYERDVRTKSEINIREKDMIGRYAAQLIEDDDVVFIDAGTTTDKLVDYISKSSATFFTNGIEHAKKLNAKGLNVIILGGKVKQNTEAVVGASAAAYISKLNFTKCFLGTNGISRKSGFTTPDCEEALIKETAAKNSLKVFVLADNSKFGIISTVSFCDIDGACIITDKVKSEKYLKSTQIKEVSER